jgi:hypothetical protein
MGVADDIKQAYQEVGMAYHVLKGLSPIELQEYSGESLIYEINAESSNPFTRVFLIEASLAYDTVVESGDILILTNGNKYTVTVLSPEILENTNIENLVGLMKVNVSGELSRFVEGSGENTYHTVQRAVSVAPSVYGTLIPVEFNSGLSNSQIGQIDLGRLHMYAPSFYDARVFDRYEPSSGEYYKIRSVSKRMYPGLDLWSLEEDTR